MSAASWFFALLFYVATAVLLIGVGRKIADYARTPAPLLIATTPAPTTRGGVWLRMLREVALFESLFKSNLWLWILGMLFHVGLALALARHLRYFTEPVCDWVVMIQPFGIYAGLAMLVGLAGLWARRLWLPRIRYLSTPSDHLMLLLLLGITASGLTMKFVSHTDIVAVKVFFLGLMRFTPQPLPADAPLYVHLTLVALLMLVFPVSKLLHAPGIFFSPTRNQPDNPREARHLAPWAAQLERK
ncbi:MAG: respiratory nitrate reductase subunit gamma [Sterolibacterium sp.]